MIGKDGLEYKDTGWMNVSCTKDGCFMRSGNPIKPKVRHDGILIIRCRKGDERKEKTAAWLVASAWHKEFYEGCYVIQNSSNDIHVESLVITDEKGFNKWRGRRISISKVGNDSVYVKYGVFKQTPIEGIECTINGVFRKGNDIKKVYYPFDNLGRKRSARIFYYINRKYTSRSAARVVAETWSPKVYYPDCMIMYKDGDKHNISNDNLIIASEKCYYSETKEGINEMTFEDYQRKVNRTATEALLIKGYMDTESLDDINKYIEKQIIPEFIEKLFRKGYSRYKAECLITESLSFFYDRLLANRPTATIYYYCWSKIKHFIKYKNWGIAEKYPPKQIERIVSQLKIDSLCEKYKVSKIKK